MLSRLLDGRSETSDFLCLPSVSKPESQTATNLANLLAPADRTGDMGLLVA